MSLSKNIERQLARIERGFAELEHPAETERDRVLKRSDERARQELERFNDCIDQVLESLEEPFFERVISEMEAAQWEQLDIRTYGEFGRDNGLSTLTTAALSLADALYQGRQIPPVLPRALCEYFESQPLDKFTYKSGGGGFGWLTSNVRCEECACPLPASYLGSGGLYGVRTLRDQPGHCDELPFKKCPACGGGVEWSAHQK